MSYHRHVSAAAQVLVLCCSSAEKEYASLSKQLNRELDEKRSVIQSLSKQLEDHQREFNELKQELSKV